MMQENGQEENSLPYLKWQLDQVTYQYEYSTELWGDRVSTILQKLQCKEEKIKALQKEVTEAKSEQELLSEELAGSKRDYQRLTWKLDAWEKHVLRQMEEHNATKRELAESCDQHKEALLKIETLNIQVENLKEDVEKWNQEASKNHNAYEELKEEKADEICVLNEENNRLKETVVKTELLINSLKQDMVKTEKLLHKERAVGATFVDKTIAQQTIVDEHAKTILALQKDNSKLAKLHHSLAEKNFVLLNSSKEATHLKQATRDLQDQVRRKTDLNVTLRSNVKELQRKNARLENEKQAYECKMEKANRELKSKNLKLMRDVDYLTQRVRVCEQQRAKQKEDVKKLEAQQHRILGDIETCMYVIEDPRLLRRSVMKLKSNCGDHLKKGQVNDNDGSSAKKVHNVNRALHTTRRAKERTEQRMESLATQFNRERTNLITVVNKQKEEIAELKIKLHNATKPKHISSWVRKKVLQRQQVRNR